VLEAVAAAAGVLWKQCAGGDVRRRSGRSGAVVLAEGAPDWPFFDQVDAAGIADASQSAPDTGRVTGAQERALEWKLDGARVQVHKASRDVRVYTRNLNESQQRVRNRAAGARLLAAQPDTRRRSDCIRPDGTPIRFN